MMFNSGIISILKIDFKVSQTFSTHKIFLFELNLIIYLIWLTYFEDFINTLGK